MLYNIFILFQIMLNTHFCMFQGTDKLYRDCWKHYDSTEGSQRAVPIYLHMSVLF